VAPIGQLLYGLAFQGCTNTPHLPLLIAGGGTALIALFGRTTLRSTTMA
jgi:hypothetical protein